MNKELREIGWTIVIPCTCWLAMLTNILNVLVLRQMVKLNKIYGYMLFKSSVNTLYLLLCSFIFLIKCEKYCFIPKTLYEIKLYELYIYNYFTSSLGLLDLLIEVVISFNRMFIISNRWDFNKIHSKSICTVLVMLSLVFYIPYLLLLKIQEQDDNASIFNSSLSNVNTSFDNKAFHHRSSIPKYQVVIRDYSYTSALDNMLSVSIFSRSFLLSTMLVSMNVTSCFQYKVRLDSKEALKAYRHSMIFILHFIFV